MKSKILKGICSFISVVVISTSISVPVFASEDFNENTTTISEKNYDPIVINKSVEQGNFKLTLEKVNASKHNLEVTASLESKDKLDEDYLENSIILLTTKSKDGLPENFSRPEIQKNSDNIVQIKFNMENFKGFSKTEDLRLDVLLPKYNLNLVSTNTVDLSKNFDKNIEKDLSIDAEPFKVDKFVTDTLGTALYVSKNFDDNSDLYDSSSKFLLKYKNKFYGLEEENYFYGEENEIRSFKTSDIKYDELKNDDECTLVYVKCKIQQDEVEKYFDDVQPNEEVSDELTKVNYEKEVVFSDSSKGEIAKVERNKDTIKAYCKSDSDEKSFLMAVGLMGYCKHTENHYIYGEKIGKSIYKDEKNENCYVVEFTNVPEELIFDIENDDIMIQHNDKFEICDEAKIK